MSIEIWKPVNGFEGLYEVSNLGRVRSLKRFTTEGKILKTNVNKGYECTILSKKGKHHNAKVHRLVATAFIQNLENKPQVNHKDGNKLNNNAGNLEWCTASENLTHARNNSLNNAGMNNHFTSVPVDMFSKDGAYIQTFPSLMEAERKTGIKRANIQGCCAKRKSCKTAGGFLWKYHSDCMEVYLIDVEDYTE